MKPKRDLIFSLLTYLTFLCMSCVYDAAWIGCLRSSVKVLNTVTPAPAQ